MVKLTKIESSKQNLNYLRNKLKLSKSTFFLLNENEKDAIAEEEEQKYFIKNILKNNKNIYLLDKYYDIKIIIYFEKEEIKQYEYLDIINEKLNEFRNKLNYNKDFKFLKLYEKTIIEDEMKINLMFLML